MAIYLNDKPLAKFFKREMFEDDIDKDKRKYFDIFRDKKGQGYSVNYLDYFIAQAKGYPETKLSFSIKGSNVPEDMRQLSEVDYDLEILGKLMPDILERYKKCHKVKNIEVGFKCVIDIKGAGESELNDIERVDEIISGKFEEFIQISSGEQIENIDKLVEKANPYKAGNFIDIKKQFISGEEIENIDKLVEKANSSKLVDRAGNFIGIMEQLKKEHNFIEVGEGLKNLRKLLGADGAQDGKASHYLAEGCGTIMRPSNEEGACVPLKGVGGGKGPDR